MININLITFDKENIIPDGKYLIRTLSIPKENVNYISARVWKAGDKMVVDVNGQTVTHISDKSLE